SASASASASAPAPATPAPAPAQPAPALPAAADIRMDLTLNLRGETRTFQTGQRPPATAGREPASERERTSFAEMMSERGGQRRERVNDAPRPQAPEPKPPVHGPRR
ncbi:MAG: hypothetical protein LBK98_11370, partial [Peptococcaceae bacterium]|nr:hypothetical protein [Peptococcaceae bacterium]